MPNFIKDDRGGLSRTIVETLQPLRLDVWVRPVESITQMTYALPLRMYPAFHALACRVSHITFADPFPEVLNQHGRCLWEQKEHPSACGDEARSISFSSDTGEGHSPRVSIRP